MRHGLLALLLPLLAACDDQPTELPPPAKLTYDATGYFCQMVIAEHLGPKGQVFIIGREEPVWFPSVRDTLAFTILPEATADVVGAYVHDMGQAEDYDRPPADAWVEATAARYVIDSAKDGGMGLPEAVPFADEAAARAFAAKHGGRVVPFDGITPDWVFATPDDLVRGGA